MNDERNEDCSRLGLLNDVIHRNADAPQALYQVRGLLIEFIADAVAVAKPNDPIDDELVEITPTGFGRIIDRKELNEPITTATVEDSSTVAFLGEQAMNADTKSLSLALTQPFPADAVHWKPLSVKGDRALAAAFIDARAVMQRLDQVFGVGGWSDAYQLVNGGSVVCSLSVLVNDQWIIKTDVGSPSEQPDSGDKLKGAFSDALKRAAVKLGVGRYLYKLPSQWVDYNPQTRQFVRPPTLPQWALPAARQSA